MKKFNKIISAFLSLAMVFTTLSAFPVESLAAGKPNSTKISNITVQCGETKVEIKEISGKFTDTCMDSYQLQYSEDKSFKTGVNTIITDSCTENLIQLEEMIAPFDTVYFRVRTQRETFKQITTKVSWSKKPQKIWVSDSITYSDWSNVYTYNAPNYSYGTYIDDGAYDAHVQAQRVIAECGITSNMSDLEKIARVQKWINTHWYYDRETDIGGTECYYSIVFDYGFSGCDHFAVAFLAFMKELNIPCKIVERDEKLGAPTSHVWNLVKVDGYWWNYDCEAYSEKSLPVEKRKYSNTSNFKATNYAEGLIDISKLTYQNCQPNGESISGTSIMEMNKKFNSLVASL